MPKMKVVFITLLVGIFYSSANDLRLVKERIRYLENRVNSESKFRNEDYSEIIYRLDEIDKVLNTSLDSREISFGKMPKETGETSSKAFDHLKEDFSRIRKAFGEEKAKMARIRREIPNLGNDLKAVQVEVDNYCKISLNNTDKAISGIEETKKMIVSEVNNTHITLLNEINENSLHDSQYLQDIASKLEQLKNNTDDIETKSFIDSKRNDVMAATVERNEANIERVYSLVTELFTNIKPLLRQVSSIEETNELIVSEITKKHITLLNEIDQNSAQDSKQLRDIAIKLEQAKKKTDDNEISERVDAIATNVEINRENIERVHSLVTEISTLIKQRSCNELLHNGVTHSGTYTLRQGPVVYCDQTTDGGGWIVFQRRLNGDIDFYRNWADYKNGFGDQNGEFWLGNEHLSSLTASGEHELRIELEDFDSNRAYAKYSKFKIYPEEDNYKLEVSGYSGTAANSLNYHNGMMFSTFDRDNDKTSGNCAFIYSAWWFKGCFRSNLNGKYYNTSGNYDDAIRWQSFSSYLAVKKVEMKFR